jgi:hypothetical protein
MVCVSVCKDARHLGLLYTIHIRYRLNDKSIIRTFWALLLDAIARGETPGLDDYIS